MHTRLFFIIKLFSLTVFQGFKSMTENEVVLNSSFTKLPEPKLNWYQILPAGKTLIDSGRTDASCNFNLSLPVKKKGYYTLFNTAQNEITLVMAPGENLRENQTARVDGKSMGNTYPVERSADSKIYAANHSFMTINLCKVDSLSRIFAESHSNPDFLSVINRLQSEYMAGFIDQEEQVISWVGNQWNSLSSLLISSKNLRTHPLFVVIVQDVRFPTPGAR